MYQNIFQAEFSVRTERVLLESGITTLEELLKLSALDLCKIPGIGKRTIQEIIGQLKDKGLYLHGDATAPIPQNKPSLQKLINGLLNIQEELQQAKEKIHDIEIRLNTILLINKCTLKETKE